MPIRLLDTNIVSFRVNSHSLAAVYDPYLVGFALGISFQTVAESLFGADKGGWGVKRRARLEARLASLITFESDRRTCEAWAFVKYTRRRQPISPTDAWIAATALAFNLELVTHNPLDFAHVPGLAVVTAGP